MVSAGILIRRFIFVLVSELLKGIALVLALAALPFRLRRNRSNQSTPVPPPSVQLTTHEPVLTPNRTQPRDTVVLIHGFPDSSLLWQSTVSRLTAEGYRCITVDLPGANGEPIPHRLGPNDIPTMIADALKPICDTPVTFIAHDWGAIYSLLIARDQPQLIHRLVLLDVGMFSPYPDTHWTVWLCIMSYQSTLALMYLLGAPCEGPYHWIVKSFKYRARPLEQVTTDMGYHYASMFSTIVKQSVRQQFESPSQSTQRSVPHLYVYGRQKLFHFHDSAYLQKVRSSPCGEVIGLPCGHWMMLELRDEWLSLVTEWLDKSEAAVPRS